MLLLKTEKRFLDGSRFSVFFDLGKKIIRT